MEVVETPLRRKGLTDEGDPDAAPLVAGRRLAAGAVARLGQISGVDVVVDATPLTNSTSSFAAQLIQSVVVDGGAAGLTVLGGPDDFVADLRTAAAALGVGDRVAYEAPTGAVL